jgi:hypothetical protein
VALSTIHLTLSQEKPLVSSSWQDLGNAVRHAYADSIDNASGLVIGSVRAFGALLPVFVLLGLPTLFVWQKLLRSRRRRAARLAELDKAAAA